MLAGVRRRRRGRRLAATVALIIGAFMASTVAAVAAQPAASLPVPALAWQPCADPAQAGFDCATARVPLDYDDPGGSSIDLAVIRHAADDPAHRIGSLFTNPGGPGLPGTQALPTALALAAPEVIARFDLISWDPRGVGASAPVLCFPSPVEGAAFFSGIAAGFPVGKAETSNWIDTYARFGQLCAQRNGELLAHVSTADTARDLDLLRQAVGDPKLSYVGVSYGTFLGATYANLFPAKVRAMVLDANLDPVAWTNGGREGALLSTSLRIGADLSSARTLQAFLSLCGEAGSDRCAFSAGSAAATQAKFTSLLRRLRKHPVTFQGEPVTYARAVRDVARALSVVQPAFGPPNWTSGAQELETLWTGGSGGTPPPAFYPFPEWGYAVQCSESPNPRRPAVFRALAGLAFARSGDLGPIGPWFDEPCASWPATADDAYTGPWDRPTANPVLLVGNTFDPVTPYEGSVAMARRLARARLLTVDGYGHSAVLNPSACATKYESDYLVSGALPPKGTVCQQDQQPFAPAAQ
jgi:pimeloyl-ACP methyl ester carboxylesterase